MEKRRTILVTGSAGKVGRHTVAKARAAGFRVVGVDLARGVFDTPLAGDLFTPDEYISGDLAADAGLMLSTLLRFAPVEAVIHVAAIPDPTHNTPSAVFCNNINSTFNVIEAVVRCGVPRLVNVSSEQVPGFFASDRVIPGVSGLPAYCPVDEGHPVAPQNPYATAKALGEQLCDAAIRRAPAGALSVVSIRPSWCQVRGGRSGR
jgi:UDP-glucose 4-epimerase